ncbi:tetratricopeptide repeat protein [Variovorax sp. HJSM1_2]|uniref:tetratricopeptide repeat protein n=1 Tax=Variovorax sp. HJSM1_2 TaxID=3366263 RepID=UPI003BD57CBC
MIEAPAPMESKSSEVENLFEQAMALHQAWDFEGAERLYRQVLDEQPEHGDAHHNLGVLLAIQGLQPAAALPHFEAALNADSAKQQYWFSYVDALIRDGQHPLAQQVLMMARANGLQPAIAATLDDRLVERPSREQPAEQALPPSMVVPEPLPHVPMPEHEKHQLVDLFQSGRYAQGEAHARDLLQLYPDEGFVWKALGSMLQSQGKKTEALEVKLRAAELMPEDAELLNNLGRSQFELGQIDAAVVALRRAVELRPDHAESYNNLGLALNAQGRVVDAHDCFLRAVEIKPDAAGVHNNLSGVYTTQGLVYEALAALEKAIQIKPDYRTAFDNLLFILNCHPDKSETEIYRMYQEYERRFGEPLRQAWRPFMRKSHLGRRLKVGYVSPDFCRHACSFFVEPLLACHDHSVVEVYAYSEKTTEDEVTQRYKGYVDHWVPTQGMSDDELAQRIRDDGVDVLVDLAGHTKGNRLAVFARKPAPVSLSWMGYGYTTGLRAVDYYLTDETSAPQGSEHLFSETLWRLADSPFTAYRPAQGMGEVNALPARSRGYVTYGTLTRGVRINQRSISVWSRVLKRVPNARLVIDSKSFLDAAIQEAMIRRFEAFGIDRARLDIGCHSPPWDVLRGIDIGLDCFPHNSGTTLIESLYMGVPFVSLAGRPSVGRIGSAILRGVGRPEWIATTEDEYVEKLVGLAQDLPQLELIRLQLRDQMKASALMDETGFARRVEDAYRQMFARWFEAQPKGEGEDFLQCLELDPMAALQAESLYNQGNQARAEKNLDQALSHFSAALALRPGFAEAHNNLGLVYQDKNQLQKAVACYEAALRVRPDYALAHHNLGNALQHLGDVVEAVACYQRALSYGLDSQHLYDNLLFLLNYHPDLSAEQIFQTYADYDARFGQAYASSWQSHQNAPAAGRVLRIAYVSPDFRQHASNRFVEPLLQLHSREKFEVFAYAELAAGDAVSTRYAALVDHWVPTLGMSDEEVANRIRADRIDVLVDLAGHTNGNRMGVFARKPAPVSVSWLGYGYTTGLRAIDYYLTDEASAPAGASAVFSEQLWRLPDAPLAAFRPMDGMGEVSALPALEHGYVVFGALTRSIRLNHKTVRVWSEILRSLPTARLVLDSQSFADLGVSENILQKFEAHGVERHRLDIGFHSPPWNVLRGIDIGLDCFPHNSGTTLFESLYMGIPFVTLAGRPSVGLIGSSILKGLGRPEWIAATEEEYVRKVIELASDVPQLAKLRAKLRDEMMASPLMDELGFTRKVEAAYLQMFSQWELEKAEKRGGKVEASGHQQVIRKPINGREKSAVGAARSLATAAGQLGVRKRQVAEPSVEAMQQLADLFKAHKFQQGEVLARAMVERFPDSGFAWKALGVMLQPQGRDAEALAAKLRAAELLPQDPEVHANLGHLLQDQGRFMEAERALLRALSLQPASVEAHNNLAITYQKLGRHDEAIAEFQTALRLNPHQEDIYSNLLFTANYHPDWSSERIYALYREYDQRFGLPFRGKWQAYTNNRTAARVLKVGYVSPDFRNHACCRFLEPLLASHNKSVVHITAYSELVQEDAATQRYRSYVDQWVPTRGLSDAALAARIRADGIDILVDVAGHTMGNRLGVFALKPAPVSLSWLGFGYTTGLTAIDYFLTDGASVPMGSEPFFAETPWRLPVAWTFRPAEGMGEPGALPALKNGHITLGALTRSVRLNQHTISVWSEIMRRLPTAHLVVDSRSFSDAAAQQMLVEKFLAQGIEAERLHIGYHSPPWDVLRGIDIGLDCFPHNSGTTLFESLFMGVPYVTLTGRPGVGCLGSAVLQGAGHAEWITDSHAAYVEKVVALALDLPALDAIRQRLRADMLASQLMDETGFANQVEQAYTRMFQLWCEGSSDPLEARILQAEAAYQKGISSFDGEQLKAAEAHFRHAIQLIPEFAEAHSRLGILLQRQGGLAAAEGHFREALALQKESPTAHYNLGQNLSLQSSFREAELSLRSALALRPEFPEALFGLDRLLQGQSRWIESEMLWRGVLLRNPEFVPGYLCLSNALRTLQRGAEALACVRKGLSVEPENTALHLQMGAVLNELGRYEEAEASCKAVLALDTGSATAWNNLAEVWNSTRRLVEAEEGFRKALALDPNLGPAHGNLGIVLQNQGKLEEAEVFMRRCMELSPENVSAHSNLLFVMNYHPDKTAEEVFSEYCALDEKFFRPLQAEWAPHTNQKRSKRVLKVGYVSPDFRNHSCCYFLEPLLSQHNKDAVHVYAYAELRNEDAATARYKSWVDHWVPTRGMSDAALAERIRADGIDILVDLAGHTGGNRLGVFARRPAPVSVSWLGYGYTTGLRAMDYFLTDAVSAPPGSEVYFSEKPWRMPVGWVYRPAGVAQIGEVGPLPALNNGYVTFGTLTRAIRVNHRTVRVWAELLRRVPNARLVIDSSSYKDSETQESLAARFVAQGIEHERLLIGFHSPGWDVLRGIDISLDCFPHNSGTTLFESLYMGVPYVTLADRPSVGRLGSSILQGVGHAEWIAESEIEYIEKAAALAQDVARLSQLRAGLRQKLQASGFMDEPAFAQNVEKAYRSMFDQWCRETV